MFECLRSTYYWYLRISLARSVKSTSEAYPSWLLRVDNKQSINCSQPTLSAVRLGSIRWNSGLYIEMSSQPSPSHNTIGPSGHDSGDDVKVHISRRGSITVSGRGSAKKSPSLKSAVGQLRAQAMKQYRLKMDEDRQTSSTPKRMLAPPVETPTEESRTSSGNFRGDINRVGKLAAEASLKASGVTTSSSDRDQSSPHKLRHAVDALHETVLDQRARAESRGISLSMALYRLEHRLRGDTTGIHALTRVRESLREMDQQRDTLLQQLAEERLSKKTIHTKITLKRLLKSWRNTKSKNAFDIWGNALVKFKAAAIKNELSKHRSALVTKMRQQMLAHTSHKIFTVWKTFAADTQKSRLWENKIKEQLETRAKAMTNRVLMRMRNALLGQCFHTMMEHARMAKEQRVRVTRTLARWTKRTVFNSFHGWSEYSLTRIRHRQIVTRVVAKVENHAVAAALGKWRSFVLEDARMRIEKEKLILKLSSNLADKADIEQILILVVEQATRLMDADRGALFLYDKATNEMYTKVAEGVDTIRISADTGIVGVCFQSGETYNVRDAYDDVRFNRTVDEKTGYRTKQVLAVPVKVSSGAVIGVLQVINRNSGRSFLVTDATLLGQYCNQLAIAIEKVKVIEMAEQRKIKKVLGWVREGLLSRTYSSWRSLWEDAVQQRLQTRKCLLLWSRKSISKAYRKWCDHVARRRRQRENVNHALHRMGRTLQTAGFRAWHDTIERMKAMETANGLYEELRRQKEAYTEQIIRRALKRMQHALITSCFNTMHKHAQDAKEQRVRVTRTLARWTKRTVFNSFHGWSEYSLTRIRHRQIVTRVVAKVENHAVAAALGKWRSFVLEDARMRIEKEKLILKMTNGIASPKDIEQIVFVCIEQAKRLMDADRGSLFLYDDSTRELYTQVAEGSPEIRLPYDAGIVGSCFTSGRILNIADPYSDDRFNQAFDRKNGYRTKQILAVPIQEVAGSKIIGVMQVINRKDNSPFTQSHTSLLMNYCCQVSAAIQNVEGRKKMEQMKMLKFVGKLRNSHLCQSWNRWQNMCAENRRLKSLMKRFSIHLKQRHVSMAFRSWETFRQTILRRRTLIGRVFGRISRTKLAAGFHTWERFCAHEQLRLAKRKDKMAHAIEVCSGLSKCQTLTDVFHVVETSISSLFGYDECQLYIVDHALATLWSANLSAETSADTTVQIPLARGQIGLVVKTGQAASNKGRDGMFHHYFPVRNVRDDILGVLDVRVSSSTGALTENEMKLGFAISTTVAAAIQTQTMMDDMATMNQQMHSAAITEQKMASIITWLFEVVGSGDGAIEHEMEIREMRDTFIRAHYGVELKGNPPLSEQVSRDAELQLKDMLVSGVMTESNESNLKEPAYRPSEVAFASNRDADFAWSKAFEDADTDNDGQISPTEFAKWFKANQTGDKDRGQAFV